MMKIKAFNLSEVLIALTIITVVGVLTISTVTTNFKKASYVAGLKEADRLISDAVGLILKENGGSPVGVFSGSNATMQVLAEKLAPIKACPNGQSGCWHNSTSDYKELDGSTGPTTPTSQARMELRNGMLLLFNNNNQNCTSSGYQIDGVNSSCSEIFVDVNGFEKPNKFGRDIFIIGISKNGTYLSGQDGSTATCSTAGNGYGCAGKVINDGGMNY